MYDVVASVCVCASFSVSTTTPQRREEVVCGLRRQPLDSHRSEQPQHHHPNNSNTNLHHS